MAIDFGRKVQGERQGVPIDPCEIYEGLDRKSDKGPLREVQREILSLWHGERRTDKEIVVKMHTGQGKTLVGLLMLKSLMNEHGGLCVYLCPNNYLVRQVITQAISFGISCRTVEGVGIPDECISGKCIFVVSVQAMFNGRSRFGVGVDRVDICGVVIDDSHACCDILQNKHALCFNKDSRVYSEVLSLFGDSLKDQGIGTFLSIESGDSRDIMSVPYWSWFDNSEKMTRVIAEEAAKGNDQQLNFMWPVMKDYIQYSRCCITAERVEISLSIIPLEKYKSFLSSKFKIFMSATVSNDAFLVKGLRVPRRVVENPLCVDSGKWSGEKMILIPAMMSDAFVKKEFVAACAKEIDKRSYGVVILVPSFVRAREWCDAGALLPKSDNIVDVLNKHLAGDYRKALVLANRYEGIDLPDNACRILVLDGLPKAKTICEMFEDSVREFCVMSCVKRARTIEQGLGRSVRGEKDYSVVVLLGADLVKVVMDGKVTALFSPQTRTQIGIGIDVAAFSKEDSFGSDSGFEVVRGVINQCLLRDDGWKGYYKGRMDKESTGEVHSDSVLSIYETEMHAELRMIEGECFKAAELFQAIADSEPFVADDKAWYIQEAARALYRCNPVESSRMQAAAFRRNRLLLKPRESFPIEKISFTATSRVSNILSNLKRYAGYEQFCVDVNNYLENLDFGRPAREFETALDWIGTILGYSCQMPDRSYRKGPDNLWAISDREYIIFECKNEVLKSRDAVYKKEAEQMLSSIEWFKKEYTECAFSSYMIIPCDKLSDDALLPQDVKCIQTAHLMRFKQDIIHFMKCFYGYNFKDLSGADVAAALSKFVFNGNEFSTKYSTEFKQK